MADQADRLAREAIAEAFSRVGGVDALVTWIEKDDQNMRLFLTQIYPKILSHQPEPAGEVEPAGPLAWLLPSAVDG